MATTKKPTTKSPLKPAKKPVKKTAKKTAKKAPPDFYRSLLLSVASGTLRHQLSGREKPVDTGVPYLFVPSLARTLRAARQHGALDVAGPMAAEGGSFALVLGPDAQLTAFFQPTPEKPRRASPRRAK